MPLVDYSDSENSETEQAQAQSEKSRPAAKGDTRSGASKSGFQKVVDKSNSRRIRAEIPSISNEDSAEGFQNGDDRPAKRAKTAGAFSGFNSFLPAPKNANKPASRTAPSGLLKGRPTGLKQGVSLKTGAAPAFSRELPTGSQDTPEWEMEQEMDFGSQEIEDEAGIGRDQGDSLPDVKENSKPIGKPTMFKPLSVGRKNPKKTKPLASTQDQKNDTASSARQTSQEPLTTTTTAAAVQPKPKKSLFSSNEYEEPETSSPAGNGQYQPILAESDGEESRRDEVDQVQSIASSSTLPPQTSARPSDLNALADSLGLTPAQRRQLFGRTATAKDTEVAHFSVSAEYSNNNNMIANEANAAPVHNPVRSIAPGKHSLQQLLNAATSQKDALEESFASGKRNKADAGSRYGW